MSAEVSEATTTAHPRRGPLGWALRWLPAVVLLLLAAGSVGAVAQLEPKPVSAAAELPPAPEVPMLSLRRDLDPFVEQVADDHLEAQLEAFARSQPPDTCLVVRGPGVDVAHRPDDPQVPASAQKLVTAAAAFVLLGPDATYRTTVRVAAPPVEGTVQDLHLVGGGDPLLATADYVARFRNTPRTFTDLGVLADRVAAAGIRRVSGQVIGDESRYDTERYHPAWPNRFVVQRQTGPLSALAVNDGFVTYPSTGGRPGRPSSSPATTAAGVFAELLADRGVEVAGGASSGPVPQPSTVVAEIESPPLGAVVAQMLRESDNATAELVLKELGLAARGTGSALAGATAVEDVVRALGLDHDAVTVSDGSGLSPANALTCDVLVDLLELGDVGPRITRGLAVAGRSGTLARRWEGTELAGRVRGKTGTLNQVTALVGAAGGETGARYRFALIVNVEAPAVIQLETVQAQRHLASLLVDPPSGPDLDHLRP